MILPQRTEKSVRGIEYRILEEHSSGGCAKIYLAQANRKRFAIKVPTETDLHERERKSLEILATGGLHPNHVLHTDAGHVEGKPFLAFRFIQHRTLAELTNQQALSLAEGVYLIRKLANAFTHTASMGLFNADIKPENMLIYSEGRCLAITDWGFAYHPALGRYLDPEGSVLGTPGYMPPEVVNGKLRIRNHRTDVYMIAASMYCMHAGRATHEDKSEENRLEATVYEDPVPLHLVADVPEEVSRVIMKALSRSPRKRQETAKQLSRDYRTEAFKYLRRELWLGERFTAPSIEATPVDTAECVDSPYKL